MVIQLKTKLTPVRYPGGKSNALKTLAPQLPREFKEYREPFFGGGSVGLYLMQEHKDVDYWINDLFYPVYCFWWTLYHQPNEMVEYIRKQKARCAIPGEIIVKGAASQSARNGATLHRACREIIEDTIKSQNMFKTACIWYILNKLSYSGMAMIGSYAPLAWDQNFTDNCIANLPKTSELMHSVKSVKITSLDYTFLLHSKLESEGVFIFMDPPYKIVHSLYGKNGDMHEGFDHQKFADNVKQCNHKWMITYNDDPDIKRWFPEPPYHLTPWELQYTMKAAKREGQEGSAKTGKSGKSGKELLILNYAN